MEKIIKINFPKKKAKRRHGSTKNVQEKNKLKRQEE